jgi:SAM-dependent methyltransferase
MWRYLPPAVTTLKPVRFYGNFLHKLARMQGDRAQAFSTLFLRNRPALELMSRLAARVPAGGSLRVAVLGCSTGAEAYSIAWRILSARPDLKLIMQAADISPEAIEVAKKGEYSVGSPQLTNTQIFENVTPPEREQIFQRDGDVMTVQSWIRDRISWSVSDARYPGIVDSLGRQDIVVANNFLCHMEPPDAEQCLCNIARLVRPQGHLFVAGIDLDVRTKVACDLGWKPVEELLEEIHEGDLYMRSFWPWHYGGLEPLNKKRQDWKIRYAAAFRTAPETRAAETEKAGALCNV